MAVLPRRRSADLLFEEFLDEQGAPEVRVFDLRTELGYTLRGVTELVWRHADGSRSLDDLVQLARDELDLTEPHAMVESALAELRAAGLLHGLGSTVRTLARRAFLHSLAAAAAVLALLSFPGTVRAGTGLPPECLSGSGAG